jgi:iron complex outermembrane receptor protein
MSRSGKIARAARATRRKGEKRGYITHIKAVMISVVAQAFLVAASSGTSDAQSIEDLRSLSIEELANIEITSVSKSTQRLSDAAAAIYVISHDDIIRSGVSTIPEMLRLAPNLQIAQLNATTYAISARGFNVGNNASMSDKLLVLIDGRTVYTPLFAGVYWDMQGVLPENIERIEVISGPGATLYGANAVNGVINIITRNSDATQGGVADVGAGNIQRGGSLQYGGRLSDNLTYRVYGEHNQFSPNKLMNGLDANDAWSKPQGGFRIDWSPPKELVTLQGDVFQASERPGSSIAGRDLVANWQHQLDGGSSLQAQAYYDVAKRFSDNDGGGFTVSTYDLSAQHRFAVGGWNDIVWGAGDRVVSYEIENTPTLLFVPAGRTLNLANAFMQDTMTLSDTVKLTVGMKLEDEPYTGLEPLPSARVSWKAADNALLWSAISRAVRAPTPVDRDIIERIGTTDIIHQSFNFRSESLTAYELGTRIQAARRLSFSVSGYYNVYDDLRSIETSPGTVLPFRWGNQMKGLVYGLEAWGDYRVVDWWRLGVGFNVLHEHFRPKPGSTDVGGVSFVADDPNHQASLRSSIDIGSNVTWDAFARYVGKLHNPAVPEYAELNMRLGWKISPALEISLSGFNLLHAHHVEFAEPGISDEVPRSFFVETRFRF